jgi:2-keto-3-deoxy-L-rhamnonate aldolase RhmA
MNEELFLAVQIETVEAVENAEEILSVDGIDGCWIGPGDLANSLGVDPSTELGRRQHEDKIKRVLDACHKTGKIPGIASGQDAKQRIEAGFRFVTAIGDGGAIRESARSVLEELRSTD